MAKSHNPQPPPGMKYVFRPWRTDPKTGRKIYASTFGFKAWPMLVPDDGK
ncbi:MAG TPA: hypothetical protein VHU23_03095 [Rhizomicrobium sp.]|jgi:hypothetical protein|nr:hypothetical protein [Rhizomicrobium sp.]